MSLNIVRQVDQQFPALLQQNVAASCYQFVVKVIAALRAQGHQAYHVCKTSGEGQYVPPGFQPRVMKGLDGKDYTITGVSHDALWCDGLQFDTVAQGNDSPDPIGMPGIPVWNAIPQQYWRPQNPPLVGDGTTPVPQPPVMPSYEAIGGDSFFRMQIGVPLQADMALAGQALNDGSSVWFSRPIFQILESYAKGQTPDTNAIIKRTRNEWRAILGLPPL
ncbi:MAG: hypothetical protein RLY20_1886 [Verrucomicrobiota bacterium]|jgi:hypothetical protein